MHQQWSEIFKIAKKHFNNSNLVSVENLTSEKKMILEIFLFFLTAAIGLVFYVKKVRWNYWKNLGVFQIPGSIPVDDLLMLRHITDIVVRTICSCELFLGLN